MPVYGDSRAGRLSLSVGLWLYDHLGGAHPGYAPHEALAATDLRQRAPFIAGDDLRAGFTYADAGSDDARFTLEIVAGALAAGAVAVNHAAVEGLLRAGGGAVEGAVVRDGPSGRTWEVHASVTVNAAGPWAVHLPGLEATRSLTRFTKGVHLVMPPLPAAHGRAADGQALLLTARSDRRVFFLIPWYGATLLGTTDTDEHGHPDQLQITDADRDYLLNAVAQRCPGLGWTRADVRGEFVGVRTLQAQQGRSAGATTREWQLIEPAPRLLMPIGGKFTSARVEGGCTVDRVFAVMRKPSPSCPTRDRPLPWAPSGPWEPWLAQQSECGMALGLDRETATACAERFGTTVALLHARLRADPTLAARIVPEAPFCRAELDHAHAEEMACNEQDVLRRRVPLAILAQNSEIIRGMARTKR